MRETRFIGIIKEEEEEEEYRGEAEEKMEATENRGRIENYIGERFREDPRDFFFKWNFEEMIRSSDAWKLEDRYLYVYISTDENRSNTVHARVGCSSDISSPARKKRKKRNGGGGGAGGEKILLWVRVPPVRNWSTKDVKDHCKRGRGCSSRCNKLIRIATRKGLDWKISRDVVRDPDSRYYLPGLSEAIDDDELLFS